MARGQRRSKKAILEAELEKIKASIQSLKEKEEALVAKKNELEEQLEGCQRDEIIDLIVESGLSVEEVAKLISESKQAGETE